MICGRSPPVIPAVAVAGQVIRPLALEVNAGQIIKHQADRLREGPLEEIFLQAHPMAVELIHGRVNIVFIKGLFVPQPAGLRQPGALSFVRQG